MTYHSTSKDLNYFPPLLGNGDLTFAPDCQGVLDYTARDFGKECTYTTFDGAVFRAGRRFPVYPDRAPARILAFGRFFFDSGRELLDWTQELSVVTGTVSSNCRYSDGMEIVSECFIHERDNLYALRKTFSGFSGEQKVEFSYSLCGYDDFTTDALILDNADIGANGADLNFRAWGQNLYTGRVSVSLDRPAEVSVEGKNVVLRATVRAGESLTFFFHIADDLGGTDFSAESSRMTQKICKLGYEGLRAESSGAWKEFFDRGWVHTADPELNDIYQTALYHLKCYTTKWSIPVGLNNVSWEGKFFAFDEYYSALALMGANQLELARRVPDFRREVCLDKAIFRASVHFEPEMALFCWETGEYGTELSPPGHWYDHIFQMSVVALGAFECYEHMGDLEYLRKNYRMIRACAMFFTNHMLTEDREGRLIVGKCTDLERLGPSVENPFMTSCGVISTLEILAESARLLDVDPEYRAQCLDAARRLRESLPKEDGRYVPFLGCPQKSIGVFSGKFPFNVLDKDDPALHAAWKDYMADELTYGNMYAIGSFVASWYACWKGEGFARCGMAEEAYAAVQQAARSTGVFHEMFEINEEKLKVKPWFTTAAGVYLSTVNEMLLQSDGQNIFLLPAFPGKDVSFKLSVKGGAVAEVLVSGGELRSLKLTMKDGIPSKTFQVYFCGKFYDTVTAE